MKNLVLIFFFIFSAFGCSKGSQTQTSLSITMGNLIELSTLQGGIFLMLQNQASEKSYFDVPASYQVGLPGGTFDMYFVAYLGPTPWQGTMYCGALPQALIQGEEMVLDVTLSSSLCSTDIVYGQMNSIKNPVAIWDLDLWDNANWAP